LIDLPPFLICLAEPGPGGQVLGPQTKGAWVRYFFQEQGAAI
jgi:hypothetical protein